MPNTHSKKSALIRAPNYKSTIKKIRAFVVKKYQLSIIKAFHKKTP